MTKEQQKPKASERLTLVEESLYEARRRTGELELLLFNHSRENELLKEALQLVHEKLDAVISLSNGGRALTKDNINEETVSLKVKEMENSIEKALEENKIEAVDSSDEDCVIVGREINEKGEVINPRIHFLVAKLHEDMKDKFLSVKIGDIVKGEEGKLDVEILGVYKGVAEEIKEEVVAEEAVEEAVEETVEETQEETK